jgi:hypothetical protein
MKCAVYYGRLIPALRALGIEEKELPTRFRAFTWQEQRTYLEGTYVWLYYCPTCRLPTNANEGKDEVYNMCKACGMRRKREYARRTG